MRQINIYKLVLFIIILLIFNQDDLFREYKAIVPSSQKSIKHINDGIYLWLNQPNAVRFKGKFDRTYFTSVKPNGKIIIQYFDHLKNTKSKEVTIYKFKKGDDHSTPTITIIKKGLEKGKILILFSRHSSDLYYTDSKKPEDIFSLKKPKTILKGDITYPSIIQNETGSLKLFFRGNNLNKKKIFNIQYNFIT